MSPDWLRCFPPKVNYWQDNPESEVDETIEFSFKQGIKGNIKASITRNLERRAIILGPEVKDYHPRKWWNPTKIDVFYKGSTE